MIQAFHYPGLGNSSYLVVDEASGSAAVVDPQRDIDQYLHTAARLGARITHAFETHVHNDFISGGRQLAERHGAALVASADAGLMFPHLGVHDGDVVRVGDRLRFRVLATPGHTPEHVSYLLEGDEGPATLFSGGALLVGTIARTDLLGQEHAPGLARQAWATLQQRLLRLPEATRVLPTHGGGSFCASGAGDAPETTIGAEKQRNRFAALVEPEVFVRAALEGLPRYPAYFARMRSLNQRGAPLLDQLPELPPLAAQAVRALLERGAELIDTRSHVAFVSGHVPGSLAIPLEPPFSQWIGWLVPPERPLVFVLESERAREQVARELIRIGYDDLRGHLEGGVEAWRAAGLPVAATMVVPIQELERLRTEHPELAVLDVRWDDEWQAGHLSGAWHLALPDLPARAHALPHGQPLAVHCAHRFRSTIAVSLLERVGLGPLYHLDGGVNGWQAAGGRLEREADAAALSG